MIALALTCALEMAKIPGMDVCIDRFEASVVDGAAQSKKGVMPTTLISQREATAACEKAGKHLCTRAEWTAACRGAEGRRYAYGGKYEPGRCNDRARGKGKAEKPLPAGSLPRCRTPEGVFDLSGNLWEWLADKLPGGATAYLVGGAWGNDDNDDNLSCVPEDTMAQPIDQKIDGLGFRCCSNSSRTP
jgi:formylglycine-generating enzyme required for sulfatase activity